MSVIEREKEQIINDSLPFIKYTACRLARRPTARLSVHDLVSVGIIGLLDALTRYTEGRIKLKTFVEYRIRGAMLDELRSQDWLPRSQRDKIGQIWKAHCRLEQELGRTPGDEEVAKSVGIELDDYYSTLQTAGSAVVYGLENFGNSDEQEGDLDVTDCASDPEAKTPLEQAEEAIEKEALARLIDALPKKEKLILSLYYWEELTMKEIGVVMNLSEGRVCQIHAQAIRKLKAQMRKFVLREL